MTVEFFDGKGMLPEKTFLIPGNTRPPQSMTEYMGWFADGITKDIMEAIVTYVQTSLADKNAEDVDGWVFRVTGRYISFTQGGWNDLVSAIIELEKGQPLRAAGTGT